jgi:hypothetical protein
LFLPPAARDDLLRPRATEADMKPVFRTFLYLLTAAAAMAGSDGPVRAANDRLTTRMQWTLSPAGGETQVPTRTTVTLRLGREVCSEQAFADGSPSVSFCHPAPLDRREREALAIEWRVNGVTAGSAEHGTIHPLDAGDAARGAGLAAVYRAPASVPAGNPVDVSAVIRSRDGAGEVQLVRQMRITDEGGWRGTIQVRLHYSHDPEELPENLAGQSLQLTPEQAITDRDRPVDRTVIESDLLYTVTQTLAEAVADNGTRQLTLLAAPSGAMRFYHRVNRPCECRLDMAEGRLSEIYEGVPLAITLATLPDRTSIIKALPGVAFAMQGSVSEENCSGADAWRYEGFFDGVTLGGKAPPQAIAGNPGDARTITGAIRIPARIAYAGTDYEGEAEVVWSLTRR